MSQIISDLNNGTITISSKFDFNADINDVNGTPIFQQPGDEYVLSFPDLKFVKKFTKLTYDTIGLTDARYLAQYYRISRDGNSWTDWLDLRRYIDNFPLVDTLDPLYIDIKWVRKGQSTIGIIRLLEFKLEGELDRPIDESGDAQTIAAGKTLIIKPPFIYKVFKITDVEIISSTGVPSDCSIKYRYSQDSSKTWSNWERLTKELITTKRINPIRFFQIEYMIENNSSQSVQIQDINLIGDFQNVTEDSKKTNLFGIRECCQSNLMGAYDANGNFIPNSTLNQTGSPACDPATGLPTMTSDEKANLYNPYQQSQAMNLLQKLSNDAQMIFGHRVKYFVTDPDKNGEDTIMHEYQLYNVVCEGELKISVEGNNFPDSQIVMNQFDLNLFESMQVHITKQQFKEVFGLQRRPAKEDFLYFCDLNRMYQVDHAQQFRNFNNSAVYYKLILKKFHNSAAINFANDELRKSVNELTKNSTIDELFGVEDSEQKNAIANKKQQQPLTREPIRLRINAQIEKELLENSSTIIAKSYYDLSSVPFGTLAVQYLNFEPIIKTTDIISFHCWFSINNYIKDEVYNFYNYYNSEFNIGYKINLVNDQFIMTLNSDTYEFNLTGTPTDDVIALEEETWYCYLVNIDQRQSVAEHFVYKRNVDFEDEAPLITSTILRQVYKHSHAITPFEFEAERFNPEIQGSDMKMTNIRLFTESVPEDHHSKIMNQYIIGEESKYLVFADNATTRLYLPKFPLFE
jgi:hypothetical protein